MQRDKQNDQEKTLGTGSGVDDEIVPRKGRQVGQQDAGGEERDTAGQHGRMAVESAKGLDESNQGT